MKREPKGPHAARLRQRKFDLLRRFAIPADLLPGTLTQTHSRCGRPTCHCADSKDPGHLAWSLTFMSAGKHRVERIPKEWAENFALGAGARDPLSTAQTRWHCDSGRVADQLLFT